jgi:hypothetical protein
MKFSMVPLLLTGKSLSGKARQALRENRRNEVATILIQEYGLSCLEACDLLDISTCDETHRAQPNGDSIAAQVKF